MYKRAYYATHAAGYIRNILPPRWKFFFCRDLNIPNPHHVTFSELGHLFLKYAEHHTVREGEDPSRLQANYSFKDDVHTLNIEDAAQRMMVVIREEKVRDVRCVEITATYQPIKDEDYAAWHTFALKEGWTDG